jgi:hypothetical protein
MVVAILRGWLGSGGVDGTLTQATVYLILFAAFGAILGHLAQTTIDESVRSKLEAELAQQAEHKG